MQPPGLKVVQRADAPKGAPESKALLGYPVEIETASTVLPSMLFSIPFFCRFGIT